MRLFESSDRSLLISFGDSISIKTHRTVLQVTEALLAAPGITNVHPAYASVLIDFDPLATTHGQIEQAARLAFESPPGALREPRVVEIPVHYGGEYGPDLVEVARLTGHSPKDVITIHSGAEYLVYFLGFSPGFPYLGGMPESIAVPRLDSPRKQVAAGSVAIGGQQTGVYPVASPGGWRVIGRTPLRLFDPESDAPILLRMGDRVRFVPLARRDF